MEPGERTEVRTDHKTLPEAERSKLWGHGQHGRLSKAPCGVRAALKTLRTARGPARGSLQMTGARHGEEISGYRQTGTAARESRLHHSVSSPWWRVWHSVYVAR